MYYTNMNLIESQSLATNTKPTPRYGCSYLLEAVQSFKKEKKAGNPRDELTLYLEAGIESVPDIISWWGVRAFNDMLKMISFCPSASDRIEISNS